MKLPDNKSSVVSRTFLSISDIIRYYVWIIGLKIGFKKVKFPSNNRIDDKTVLITGSNRGIGKSMAIELAKRGGNVILACRNLDQANQLAQQINSSLNNNNKVSTVHLDLNSLASVRKCAETIISTVDSLDILINNAGLAGNSKRIVTSDGFEQLMQVNYYGPWLLTQLLLPVIRKSPFPGRIIFTASAGHRFITTIDLDNLNSEKSHLAAYNYGLSKMGNILTTVYLASMLKDSGITVNSFCPGITYTNLMYMCTFNNPWFSWTKPILKLIFQTTDQGAQSAIYLATDETIKSITGSHFANCSLVRCSQLASDLDSAEKLWVFTEKQLKSHLNK